MNQEMERPVFVGHNRIQKAVPAAQIAEKPLLARRESATRFHLGRSRSPGSTDDRNSLIPHPQSDTANDASHSGELRLLCRSGVVICRGMRQEEKDLFGSKVMGYPGVEFPQRLG